MQIHISPVCCFLWLNAETVKDRQDLVRRTNLSSFFELKNLIMLGEAYPSKILSYKVRAAKTSYNKRQIYN